MKTTIVTLAAVTVLSFGSLFGNNASKVYKNTINDEQNNTKVTTVYKGTNDKYLTPLKEYTIVCNSDGSVAERTIRVWDSSKNIWVNFSKYEYVNNGQGQLVVLNYVEWDTNTRLWNKNAQYVALNQNQDDDNFIVDNNSK